METRRLASPPMGFLRWAGSAIIAGALALGGCGSTQERAFTLDLAPTTGPLAVDIENFRGSVDVRADSSIDQIEVVGLVRSSELFEKPVQAEAFAGVNVTAEIVEDGPRGTLRIRSTSNRAEFDDHHVRLIVRTPRCDGLRIRNDGGDISAVNCGGAADIMNKSGAVEFRTSRPIVDSVLITTTDGNIYYQVPPGSTGKFDLHTLDGMTSFTDRVGGSSASRSSTTDAYTGVLNEGVNDVVARTNNGDVRVWVMEDPVALVRMFKWRIPDPRDHMFLHGPRRHTRNLPVDHPEVTGKSPFRGHAFDYEVNPTNH